MDALSDIPELCHRIFAACEQETPITREGDCSDRTYVTLAQRNARTRARTLSRLRTFSLMQPRTYLSELLRQFRGSRGQPAGAGKGLWTRLVATRESRPKPPAKHIMESEPLLKRDLECDGYAAQKVGKFLQNPNSPYFFSIQRLISLLVRLVL